MTKFLVISIILSISVSLKAQISKSTEIEKLEEKGFYTFSELNDFKASKEIFKEILSIDPNHFQANFLLGWSNYELDNYEDALKYLNKAIETNALTDVNLLYGIRGLTNCELGNYEESVKDFNKAIENKPSDFLFHSRAKTLIRLGKYRNALEDLNKSIELGENSSSVYFDRAISFQNIERYEEAISDYQKSLQFEENFPDAYYFMGNIYYDSEMYKLAIENFSLYQSYGNDENKKKDARFKRGVSYYYIENYQESLDKLNESKEELPEYEGIYIILGMNYIALENYGNARTNLVKALEIAPENSLALYQMGKLEQLVNNKKEGYDLFEKAGKLAEKEKDQTVLYYLTQSYAMLGDTIKALACVNKAISINPQSIKAIEARISLNSLFFPNKEKEVMSDFDLLKSLFKEYSEVQAFYTARKAVALMEFGHLQEASNELDEAIKLHHFSEYYALKSLLKFYFETDKAKQNGKKGLEKNIQEEILRNINEALSFNHRKRDTYLLKATILIALERNKEACESANQAINLGANISTEQLKFICKGKEIKEKNNQWEFNYNLSTFEERFSTASSK
jgi:tetratricopeptide (TPR) repeat protein